MAPLCVKGRQFVLALTEAGAKVKTVSANGPVPGARHHLPRGTFAHTTWNLPSAVGYLDNQAGVLWDATTRRSIRIPAAVQVHRGRGIVFIDVGISG